MDKAKKNCLKRIDGAPLGDDWFLLVYERHLIMLPGTTLG